jgi:hypothetical protein
MQRARRFASIAVVAALGSIVLSGCRSEPDVAAYLGDKRITEDQVTAVIDEVQEKIQPDSGMRAPARDQVLGTMVFGELCARLTAERGYRSPGQILPEQVAQQFGVPADTAYARHTADLLSCLGGVPAENLAAPTEEQLADVVARGKAGGALPDTYSLSDAAELDGDQLRTALATRKLLTEAAEEFDITVNPRYRPLEYPLLSFQGNVAAVSVPLGEADSGAVIEAD